LKKVLVLGGSGFLGRQLIKELIIQGYEVSAIEHSKPLDDNKNIRIIKGGIGAVDSRLTDAVRPDTVFHLARPTFPYLRKTGRLLAAHYAAILNGRLIRELASSHQKPRLVFASGSLMYGSSPLPHDEDAPIRPISYARQYYRGEMPIIKALESGKIPVKIIRFPWILGKGSWFEWFYLKSMEQSRAVPLFGKGDNMMEILDIHDAVGIALKYADDNVESGIYNLVSAGPITQLKFATAVSRASGFPVKDYREIFSGRMEKEAMEAFNSNIVLATKHPHLTDNFQFTPLEETLKRLITD